MRTGRRLQKTAPRPTVPRRAVPWHQAVAAAGGVEAREASGLGAAASHLPTSGSGGRARPTPAASPAVLTGAETLPPAWAAAGPPADATAAAAARISAGAAAASAASHTTAAGGADEEAAAAPRTDPPTAASAAGSASTAATGEAPATEAAARAPSRSLDAHAAVGPASTQRATSAHSRSQQPQPWWGAPVPKGAAACSRVQATSPSEAHGHRHNDDPGAPPAAPTAAARAA
jgi:hypothetical protein